MQGEEFLKSLFKIIYQNMNKIRVQRILIPMQPGSQYKSQEKCFHHFLKGLNLCFGQGFPKNF